MDNENICSLFVPLALTVSRDELLSLWPLFVTAVNSLVGDLCYSLGRCLTFEECHLFLI